MDIFERFSRILDNYAFPQVGCMFIATEQQYRDGEDEHQMHRRVGAQCEILKDREVEQCFAALRLQEDEYGILGLRGGWNEPDTYIAALAAQVRDMGVEII